MAIGRLGRGAKAGFEAQAEAAIYTRHDIPQAVNAVGRRRLAEMLSGTKDRKSREYKRERDYISRTLRNRNRGATGKMRAERAERTSKAMRQNAKEIITASGPTTTVEFYADVKVSKRWDRGAGNNGRRIRATLSGAERDRFLKAVESGDSRTAVNTVMAGYGISSAGHVGNIHDVTIT